MSKLEKHQGTYLRLGELPQQVSLSVQSGQTPQDEGREELLGHKEVISQPEETEVTKWSSLNGKLEEGAESNEVPRIISEQNLTKSAIIIPLPIHDPVNFEKIQQFLMAGSCWRLGVHVEKIQQFLMAGIRWKLEEGAESNEVPRFIFKQNLTKSAIISLETEASIFGPGSDSNQLHPYHGEVPASSNNARPEKAKTQPTGLVWYSTYLLSMDSNPAVPGSPTPGPGSGMGPKFGESSATASRAALASPPEPSWEASEETTNVDPACIGVQDLSSKYGCSHT